MNLIISANASTENDQITKIVSYVLYDSKGARTIKPEETQKARTLPEDEIERLLREQKIKAYEAQFSMTSEEFLKQWEAGIAPDEYATNHWADLLSRDY